jgi:D-alanyl-D-alanine carboxypeptidase
VHRIPVIGGSKDTLTVVNPEAVSVILPKKDYNISSRTQLYRYVIAPIQKGEIIGEVIYYADGKECARVALAAAEDIYRQKDKSIIDRILSIFK